MLAGNERDKVENLRRSGEDLRGLAPLQLGRTFRGSGRLPRSAAETLSTLFFFFFFFIYFFPIREKERGGGRGVGGVVSCRNPFAADKLKL